MPSIAEHAVETDGLVGERPGIEEIRGDGADAGQKHAAATTQTAPAIGLVVAAFTGENAAKNPV